MPGQPRNQRFYVTIPRGVRPGQHFAVLVNGQQMMVRKLEFIDTWYIFITSLNPNRYLYLSTWIYAQKKGSMSR